jgi:hypothetical protein
MRDASVATKRQPALAVGMAPTDSVQQCSYARSLGLGTWFGVVLDRGKRPGSTPRPTSARACASWPSGREGRERPRDPREAPSSRVRRGPGREAPGNGSANPHPFSPRRQLPRTGTPTPTRARTPKPRTRQAANALPRWQSDQAYLSRFAPVNASATRSLAAAAPLAAVSASVNWLL